MSGGRRRPGEEERVSYRMRQCDVMALALHRATGLPLGLWRGFRPPPDGAGGQSVEDCHAAVFLSFDPPRWIDVDGLHDGVPHDLSFTAPVVRVACVEATEDDVAEAFALRRDGIEESLRAARGFIERDGALSDLAERLSRRTLPAAG